MQVKVFSRWVSSHLREGKSDIVVNDITKDLTNGVALVELAEILIGKESPRHWSRSPKRNVDMVQNCDLAIDMFTKDGVRFVGISGKDINDNKEKLILGLIWTLILHYSISKSVSNDTERINSSVSTRNATTTSSSSSTNTTTATQISKSSKNSKDVLKQWAIDRTSNYPNIHNFSPYDLSMCALLDSYVPDKINYYSLDPKDSEHNAELATKVMQELDIPVYVYPEDYEGRNKVDEKALLTQLSTAKVNLEKLPPPPPQQQQQQQQTDVEESKVEERGIEGFNESNVINNEAGFYEDEIIRQSAFAETSNVEEAVERFNESNEVFEEVEDDDEIINRNQEIINKEFVPFKVESDNSQYAGRKFGMIMNLQEKDIQGINNEGNNYKQTKEGNIRLALTMTKDGESFLNPAGLKLDVASPNVAKDVYQQFTFGQNEWNTVIDSFVRPGMVWDVADRDNLNPPSGTPFYLFPFHGRHNQHFVYHNNMIYATQNGMVVTYVGGEHPLQMMPINPEVKSRQTFDIELL